MKFLYLTKVLSGLQQPHQSHPIWKHLVRTGRLINTLFRVLSGGCFSWCFSEFHSLLYNLISMRGWFMQLTLVFPFDLPYPDGPWFVFIRYSRFFSFSAKALGLNYIWNCGDFSKSEFPDFNSFHLNLSSKCGWSMQLTLLLAPNLPYSDSFRLVFISFQR